MSMKFLPTAIAILILAGCASFDGRGLAPGAPAAQVESVMGPAADKRVHGGETWLYYPRQPYGMVNYVARFDADGRLIAIEQRLTEENVAKIERGKWRADDVRDLLGPPYKVWPFPRMQRDIWDYRMMIAAAGSTPQALYVQLSPDGIVREVYVMNDPDNRLSECCGR
jgi:hypothetical protein